MSCPVVTASHTDDSACLANAQPVFHFQNIASKPACYDLEGFLPLDVDAQLLAKQGLPYTLSTEVAAQLRQGSAWFAELYHNKSLMPERSYLNGWTAPDEELEIHNYTNICPANVLEVSPSAGSCAVGCQYCLVTDGNHVQPITVFTNYAERLANSLERNRDRALFYYYSPKTEAFSEPHLENGLAHDILRTFIRHFDKYPESPVRIFIATKVGPKHMAVRHGGDTPLALMGKIAPKIQINGSIGVMPGYLRDVLEPNAASVEERLDLLVQCRELGMVAESVLCQPLILPYQTEENLGQYCSQLAAAGVKNIKPEFLTTEVRNLVVLAQYINHFDPQLIGEFFHPYLDAQNQDHIKQRSRLAPDRRACVEKLDVIRTIAQQHGITISLCNWVKRELSSVAEWVQTIDKASAANGFRCLGYQTRLFPRQQ